MRKHCGNCANRREETNTLSKACEMCIQAVLENGEKTDPSHWKEKPQTNADRIRAISDEELAEWVARTQIRAIKDAMNLLRLPYYEPDELVEIGKTEILKWLRRPAEEK